jgi:hypothetical protein
MIGWLIVAGWRLCAAYHRTTYLCAAVSTEIDGRIPQIVRKSIYDAL